MMRYAVIALLVLASAARAQRTEVTRLAHPMTFDRLTSADGLPNTHVRAVVQDGFGFVWFGTQDGLARYDGHRMRVIKHAGLAASSVVYVTALAVDGAGSIWVGTAEHGITRYDPKTDKFTAFPLKAGAAVTDIVADKKDRIWFAISTGGLVHFSPETKKLEEHAAKPLDVPITTLDIDSGGNLWLGTPNDGVLRWNPDTGASESYRPTDAAIPSVTITSLLAASNGSIWIGSDGEGLVSLDPATRKVVRYRHVADDPSSIADDRVTALYEDKSKEIWVGTSNGLDRLEGTKFAHYFHDPTDPLSLPFPGVESIYQDAGGVMWVGGFTVGVAKFEPSRAKFGRYKTLTHPANSFWEDADKTLWVGTYHGGLYKLDLAARKVSRYTEFGTGDGAVTFNAAWITSLQRDRAGTLWIGLQSGSLIGFDTKDETFRRYGADVANTLAVDTIWDIWEDPQGKLWLATWGGGLVQFDPVKETFKAFTTEDKVGLTSDNISTLYADPTDKNVLWLGSAEGGVMRFELGSSKVTQTHRHKADDTNSLSTDNVLTLYRNEDTLWVGTYGGGLNKVDLPSGKVQRFSSSSSKLPNDVIYGILPDDTGGLWISTNGGGLVQMDPKTSSFVVFSTADGVQGNEFAQGGFMRTKAGMLCFGGVDGFNAFMPKDIARDTHQPKVVATALQMYGKEVKLATPLWTLPTINVSYADSFEVQFAAVAFGAPKQTRFAYKLEGFDNDFIETDRPSATYTKLDGGKYTLRVRAMNRHGVWNEAGVALAIAVKPPFYRTWPAYILYMAALVGIILFIAYLQRQRVRRIIREGRLAVVERDLALTGAVQTGFLPEYNEITGGSVELYGFFRGADACSGDWWWHEVIGQRHVVLVGDVTGHGPGPAMVTAAVATAFRVLIDSGMHDIPTILESLNRTVLQVGKGKYSMTMVVFEIDQTGAWQMFSAGAPPLMSLSQGKHRVHFSAGTALGTEVSFQPGYLNGALEPGDRMLIYTDGIPEIMLSNGTTLGMRRFAQMYERTADQQLRDAAATIVQQADQTKGAAGQDDDWTFALVEWRGATAQRGRASARRIAETG
jgi:ligand-binding sensor domain-containing protein